MEEQGQSLYTLLNKGLFIVHDLLKKEAQFMKEKEDRRIQKTRKLLHEAVVSLILEKNYESVSVQDILDRANVGRSTFYTHFQNKDELLTSGVHNDLRDMLQTAQASASAASSKPYEKIIGFSLAMFEHAYEYRGVWRAMLGSRAGAIVRQNMQKMLADLIRDGLKKEFPGRNKSNSRVPTELFIHFLASTFMSVLSWWLNRKDPLPPEAIDEIFRALVLPGLTSNFA